MVTLAFLAEIRGEMRIEGNEFDRELVSKIEAARGELREIGIRRSCVNNERNPLITAAIVTYVKAEFGLGLDAKDRADYREAFEMKRYKLSMSCDYLERKRGEG